MKIAQLNFLEYLAREEQNLLSSIVNFREDFDFIYRLDNIYREPLQYIEVDKPEEFVPRLLLFVHFHMYFSVSCLIRSHFSECLASVRKAIDASLSAYRIILDPKTAKLYEKRDKTFLHIKSYIQAERKKDGNKYPIAKSLLELHDMCSEYGSHADVSSFIDRVEILDLPDPRKQQLRFHYFQFPRDPNEYAIHLVDTLWAFYVMLFIFKDFIGSKLKDRSTDWSQNLEEIGSQLFRRKTELYLFKDK